jgi:hypothetical protein
MAHLENTAEQHFAIKTGSFEFETTGAAIMVCKERSPTVRAFLTNSRGGFTDMLESLMNISLNPPLRTDRQKGLE